MYVFHYVNRIICILNIIKVGYDISGNIISEVNMASRKQNCSKRPKLALLTHKGTFVYW